MVVESRVQIEINKQCNNTKFKLLRNKRKNHMYIQNSIRTQCISSNINIDMKCDCYRMNQMLIQNHNIFIYVDKDKFNVTVIKSSCT